MIPTTVYIDNPQVVGIWYECELWLSSKANEIRVGDVLTDTADNQYRVTGFYNFSNPSQDETTNLFQDGWRAKLEYITQDVAPLQDTDYNSTIQTIELPGLLPEVAWASDIYDISLSIPAYNYRCKIGIAASGDPGAGIVEEGFYVVDNGGKIYFVVEVLGIGEGYTEILVKDITENSNTNPPLPGMGFVYKTLKQAAVLPQAKMYLLDATSRDLVNGIERAVTWSHRGVKVFDGEKEITNITQIDLEGLEAEEIPQPAWVGGKRLKLSGAPEFNPQVTKVVYVDIERTDDYTPDGSIFKPFKSINAVLPQCDSGTVIYLSSGNYVEDVALPAGVSLYGTGTAATMITGDLSIPAGAPISIRTIVFSGGDKSVTINTSCSFEDCFIYSRLVVGGAAVIQSWNTHVVPSQEGVPAITMNSTGKLQMFLATVSSTGTTSAVVQNNGQIIFNTLQITNNSNSQPTILSSAGTVVLISTQVVNLGSAAAIDLSGNDATVMSPNMISDVAALRNVICGAKHTVVEGLQFINNVGVLSGTEIKYRPSSMINVDDSNFTNNLAGAGTILQGVLEVIDELGVEGAEGATGPIGPEGEDGATGPQGEDGATGPIGIQGDTGATGPVGLEGATGPQGIQGITGPQGIQGITGPIGPQGITGPQGIQGVTGPVGPEGATGPQGIQGVTGATGETGATGPEGATGAAADVMTFKGNFNTASDMEAAETAVPDNGDFWHITADFTHGGVNYKADDEVVWSGTASDWVIVGSSITTVVGPTGPEGPQGETGETGPQGIQGVTGPQGIQGITGPIGPQGDQGITGPQGVTGPQGDQGVTGPQGPQGVTGPQGIQGVTGPVGPEGEQGFTGPQGIQGETGLQGETGPQGIQGITGPVGPQGPTGPQGIQGVTGAIGPTGPHGNPVYTGQIETVDDKTYIIDLVAAYQYMITEFRIQTQSGSCNYALQSGNAGSETNILTGTVNTTLQTHTSLTRTVSVGHRLRLVITNNSSAEDMAFTIKMAS